MATLSRRYPSTMVPSAGPLLLLALLLAPHLCRARPHHPQQDQGSSTSYKLPFPKETEEEVETIEADVQKAAEEPYSMQKKEMKRMGDALVAKQMWDCNIFGGSSACQYMSVESGFKEQCPKQNNLIDCALRAGAEEAFSGDFYGQLGHVFKDSGFPPCRSCLENLRRFWCGQAVPTCTAFDSVVNTLLPAVQQIIRNHEQGKLALQSLMPDLLHSLAVGLPCREMCEQVIGYCSCGNSSFTFGQIVDMIESGQFETGAPAPADKVVSETDIAPTLADDLFKEVRDWKPCDLFLPKDAVGFLGVCVVETEWGPTRKNKSCSWCNGVNKEQSEAQKLLDSVFVSQMLRSVSSMMRSGVQHVLDAAGAPDPRGGTEEAREEAADVAVSVGKEQWDWKDTEGANREGTTGGVAAEGPIDEEKEKGGERVMDEGGGGAKKGEEEGGGEGKEKGEEGEKEGREGSEEGKDGDEKTESESEKVKEEEDKEEVAEGNVYKRQPEGEEGRGDAGAGKEGSHKGLPGTGMPGEGGMPGEHGRPGQGGMPGGVDGVMGSGTDGGGMGGTEQAGHMGQGERGSGQMGGMGGGAGGQSGIEGGQGGTEPGQESQMGGPETEEEAGHPVEPQPTGGPSWDHMGGGAGSHMGGAGGTPSGDHMGGSQDHMQGHDEMMGGASGAPGADPQQHHGTMSWMYGGPSASVETQQGSLRASESSPQPSGSSSSGGGQGLVFFLVTAAVGVAAIVGFMQWQRWRQRRAGEMYVSLQEIGYQPPSL